MTRNRPPRQPSRPGVEAFESRCLLSAATVEPIAGIVPQLAESPPSGVTSSVALTSQDAIIGASEARSTFGVTGAGLTAAVIDTGVDYDHPAFGGGIGDGNVVLAGHDFADGDADPRATQSAHGTAVAGIIASRDPKAMGVAPGAEIAALRVFGDDGRGSFDAIADALQWVITNHERYNISVVNLSISDGKNYLTAPSLFAGPVVTRIIGLIDTLEGLNIPVVTAAGNSFSGKQGMGFTAIVDNTISVTGSDGPDRIASDAQRLGQGAGGKSATDLLAPGRQVVGPWVGTSFSPLDGTSFAAPLVTGSVLLLQELYLKRFGMLPSVDQLEGWLRDSAVPVRDAATGITIGRLDIPAAAAMVPSPAAPRPPVEAVTPIGGGSGTPQAKPGSGGPVNPPSVPVAEPPVGSGGSDKGKGSGSGSTGGSKPTAPSDRTPGPGGSGSSAVDSPPGTPSDAPPEGSPPTDPKDAPSPDRGSPSPVEEEQVVVTAPPASSGPISSPPSSDAGSRPAPAPEPAPTTEPGPEVVPPSSPAADPAEQEAPSGTTGVGSPLEAVVEPVVIDAALESAEVEEELITGGSIDESAAPVADPGPTPDASSALAALFSRGGPAFGVRAWSLGRPGSGAVWTRAQFLRSSRASTVSQLRAPRPAEGIRPFPTGSTRLFAAIEARRSMR
jgi:type VI secretion system secreted protein VgrG